MIIGPSIHNSTSVFRLVKQNKQSFSSIEINNSLPAPVHSVLQIRFKFRSQSQLLLQMRCLITFRVESSIISIDSNITDNIRKVINAQQEKCRTKNEALRSSSINWIFMCRLSIQNHPSRLLLRKRSKKSKISDLKFQSL